MKNIENTAELRNFLTAMMIDVANGKVSAQTALATAKLAGQVNASVRLELDALKQIRDTGDAATHSVKPLRLISED